MHLLFVWKFIAIPVALPRTILFLIPRQLPRPSRSSLDKLRFNERAEAVAARLNGKPGKPGKPILLESGWRPRS